MKLVTKTRKAVSLIIAFVMVFSMCMEVLISSVSAGGSGMPGARSASNDSGDVFLGGNYIEVGISKGGSFGSCEAPPENSHQMCTESSGLGLVSDGDGFDVGEESITGDFFLPGSPEERFVVGYTIDGTQYSYAEADRESEVWEDPIQELTTVNESDISAGILKAVTTGITADNVKVVQTVSFGVDDKFFKVDVEITNLSDKTLKSVRYVRSFDPDQDLDKNDTYDAYDTYNKVICNPNSSVEYTDGQCAMVVARGAKTYAGFFFIAFDKRARASAAYFSPDTAYDEELWVDDSTLGNTPDLDLIECSESDTNGYVLEDSGIAVTFACGDLPAGSSTTLSYYSSLDPDVESSLKEVLSSVGILMVEDKTTTSITIVTSDDEEYSIDGGKTWQSSGVFEGLTPGTEYSIIARKKAVGGGAPGEAGEPVIVITRVDNYAEPIDPVINCITENSIGVIVEKGQEYSIDGGVTWSKSGIFTGLKPKTKYIVVSRISATDTTMAISIHVRVQNNFQECSWR